mmetsp:Transcript_51975/g.117406  ORF Transcript_51975/g.117406 Transcript_51975/m.117406 type:complete len:156 (-) Transcript_51975:55-522(-)
MPMCSLVAAGLMGWHGVTHTGYAAFDINGGLVMRQVGELPYLLVRYSELLMHLAVGFAYTRRDHLLHGFFHLWKYIDITKGGLTTSAPGFCYFLDCWDALTWLYSACVFDASVLPFVVLCYGLLCMYVGLPAVVRGNDSVGSLSVGASMLSNKVP